MVEVNHPEKQAFVKHKQSVVKATTVFGTEGPATVFSILKEIIQNANDAGATRLDLGWVSETSEDSTHPMLCSAALFAVNDGPYIHRL